ncbi:glycosyltransferase [Paenibacillus andongensis]|uniref:glycosyltransferase n=1 Tax=Paenibacillus andongensis TaxID=2975482 RepID=UPI0021BADE02|nr:glycosyltransferase [Paenibacillus andongensis]
MSDQPVRILHHISDMNRGEAQSFIMNVYRHLDRSKIQFDFVVHTHNPSDYDEEIRAFGGRIFILQRPRAGWMGYIYELKSTIQQHGPFHALHNHTYEASVLTLLTSKLYGIDIRIAHYHSTSDFTYSSSTTKISRWLKRNMIRRIATSWVSSSITISQALFGYQWVKDKRGRMVRNGIDVGRFASRLQKPMTLREQLHIPPNEPIIGHIGRFSAAKNHTFLIEIFEELLYRVPNARLILVGDGALRPQILALIEQKGIQNRVHLLGLRDDISELLQEFDVMVLPSFKDGLPMVLIEAQAAGVPCVVSDVFPEEADLRAGFFAFVCLKQDIAVWVQWLMRALRSDPVPVDERIRAIRLAGYDIKEVALELEDVYAFQ